MAARRGATRLGGALLANNGWRAPLLDNPVPVVRRSIGPTRMRNAAFGAAASGAWSHASGDGRVAVAMATRGVAFCIVSRCSAGCPTAPSVRHGGG